MDQAAGTLGIQIHVELDPEDGQGIDSESIAADRVAEGTFRLRDSPFFAFDLSAGDTVRAEKNVDGEWHMREVVERGGHSTFRIYLEGERAFRDDDVQAHWTPIAAMGARADSANDRFFAVDVPPGSDVAAMYEAMEKGEAAGLWEFEEAHYEAGADDAAGEGLS